MSTRFTQLNTPMVESKTLQLVQSTSQLNDVLQKYVLKKLADKGYATITPPLLSFLSTLDCGINYGSEIARKLGVSRQMVAKTVKELCLLGYLEQRDGKGKQKDILFTKTGELLIAEARQVLFELDDVLFEHVGENNVNKLVPALENLVGVINNRLA